MTQTKEPLIETPADLEAALLYQLGHGEDKAVKGEVLRVLLGLSDFRQARRSMADMRGRGIPVVGSKKGYFIASNLNEIDQAINQHTKYIIAHRADLTDLERIRGWYAGQRRMELKV